MSTIDFLLDIVKDYAGIFALAAVISIVLFIGTIAALPLIIIAMPADYFTRRQKHAQNKSARGQPKIHTYSARTALRKRYTHPLLVLPVLLLKNIAGALFVLLGIVMLVTPGQGLLTIFAGLLLMNFPGKRRMELALVSRPAILKAIQWIRTKAGKEALQLPEQEKP